MTPIQKADLFLQMYGQYCHYHQQVKDETQEPMINVLVCRNVSETLQKEKIDFSVQLFRKKTNHPYPAIVIDDIAWSIDGPLYLNTQHSDYAIRQLSSSYSPSDFIEKFNEEYSDYVFQNALEMEKEEGLRNALSFSLNQTVNKLPVTLLTVESQSGENHANLLIQSSELLDTILNNPLHSMYSTLLSVGDCRYAFHPLEELKASLNPLWDFFYLSPTSPFTKEEVTEMFYDLNEIPVRSAKLKATFDSIRKVAPQLREHPDMDTVSLTFSPLPLSVTKTTFQSNAFHYNFEIKSENDFQKMKDFLILTKNLNFFGLLYANLSTQIQLGFLGEVRPHNIMGSFVTSSNSGQQFKNNFIQLEHLDRTLPMLGHFPALFQTIQYQRDIRPAAQPAKPKFTYRF